MRSVSKSSSGGFTLVELLVVVLILGILAAVAMPKVWNNSRDAKLLATIQSVRAIQDAAEMYFAEHRAWPPTSFPGDCPDALRPYLRNDVFKREPPLGGSYAWVSNWPLSPYRAAISIVWTRGFPREDCTMLDRNWDDGFANSGGIRFAGSNGTLGQLFFESASW